MHVLIVADQHPESLGGVQVALRLQRRHLELAGHTVTIAAPALARRGFEVAAVDRAATLDLPSFPITRDREYGLSRPGRRTDRVLDAGIAERAAAGAPPVDLVHVQGDFWGAMIGLRFARRHGLPVVITMHNNVDEGTRAVTPLAPLVFAALRVWRRLAVGRAGAGAFAAHSDGTARAGGRGLPAGSRRPRGAWRYLAELAADAALVTAPSEHFAAELERRGVVRAVAGAGVDAVGAAPIEVTPGGVDDAEIAAARAAPRSPRERPRLVWLGRMSGEKRILEFVSAFAESGADADVVLHGAGLLLAKVRRRIAELGLQGRVALAGPVPHAAALAAMRDADALVQTSVGFETQGLTPFEAAALGTPTIFCDPSIARDLGVGPAWLAGGTAVSDLAAALREAVSALAAAPGELRVADEVAAGLLQSARTAEMIRHYERVLGR